LQGLLAVVAKGRMSEIVGQTTGFNQIFEMRKLKDYLFPVRVFNQPRNRPSNLGALECVGKPGAKEIACLRAHDLALSLEPPKGARVHYPITVLGDS
jgi:hypothetical protein